VDGSTRRRPTLNIPHVSEPSINLGDKMSLKVKSTKRYKYLPCGHAQYFDKEADGSPGECASVHGYDREVEFTFAGEVDEHGWVVPFGELGVVKKFLEYYFDHVTVLSADDPRLDQITPEMKQPGGLLGTLRVLPYGVSMEMSSLFIWEQVNAFIYRVTDGRCYVEKVQCIEHDRNSAFVEVDEKTAVKNAKLRLQQPDGAMIMKPEWDWVKPIEALQHINS